MDRIERRTPSRVPGPKSPPEKVPDHVPGKVGQQLIAQVSQPPIVLGKPSTEIVPALAPEPQPRPKIAAATAAVMSEIGTIKKGGRNKFHGYDYARMEDLLHVLTPLMGKHGIMVTQTLVSYNMVEGNRVIADYDFTVYVDDEVLPPARQPGMCMARDSKGGIDDKALNKCHTQARKYFLLGHFNVPAGDFDDSDADDGQKAPEKQGAPERERVPGPRQEPQRQQEPPEPELPTAPQRLTLGPGAGAAAWAFAYIKCIENAKTGEEIHRWNKLNDLILQRLCDTEPTIYARIEAAMDEKLAQLNVLIETRVPGGMPDPEEDVTVAIQWVAQQLADFKDYSKAETFWNTTVAPRENEFDRTDFEVLLAEWRRTETRLDRDRIDQA